MVAQRLGAARDSGAAGSLIRTAPFATGGGNRPLGTPVRSAFTPIPVNGQISAAGACSGRTRAEGESGNGGPVRNVRIVRAIVVSCAFLSVSAIAAEDDLALSVRAMKRELGTAREAAKARPPAAVVVANGGALANAATDAAARPGDNDNMIFNTHGYRSY